MKKIAYLLLSILILVLSFGLLACRDNNSSVPEGPEEKDNTVYSVTCVASDYYTYGGTVSATSGTVANFKITSNFSACEIIGCTFNGNECERVNENDEENNKFSFIMPSSNVEIKVLCNWKEVSTAGYQNFLSFEESNEYVTTSKMGDDSYDNDEYWGEPLILHYNTNAGYMTIANVTCFSTNEEVMPSTAISVKNTTAKESNKIVGGRIIIDRSKIKVGTTQVVLRVKSDNNNSYDAIIVAKITIN